MKRKEISWLVWGIHLHVVRKQSEPRPRHYSQCSVRQSSRAHAEFKSASSSIFCL